jgi:hypothetical protein
MAAVCSQVTTLTTRANALLAGINGLSLDPLNLVDLVIPNLPPPLSAFSCP